MKHEYYILSPCIKINFFFTNNHLILKRLRIWLIYLNEVFLIFLSRNVQEDTILSELVLEPWWWSLGVIKQSKLYKKCIFITICQQIHCIDNIKEISLIRHLKESTGMVWSKYTLLYCLLYVLLPLKWLWAVVLCWHSTSSPLSPKFSSLSQLLTFIPTAINVIVENRSSHY